MATPLQTVILRSDIPKPELELLSYYFKTIVSEQGHEIKYCQCEKIDVSHPNYLEIEIRHPKNLNILELRIPHNLVFLIDASGGNPIVFH